ncbi:hypothetical protein V1512DRAFT_263625 [Lipomyces arxii]|uniref:uncharacterized protein n=1 Tax=Lipomyces arxii TaxID=56418 RepID=UPI0034CE4612
MKAHYMSLEDDSTHTDLISSWRQSRVSVFRRIFHGRRYAQSVRQHIEASRKSDRIVQAPSNSSEQPNLEFAQNSWDQNSIAELTPEFTAWLGDSNHEDARKAYLSNFDWTGVSVLAAVRCLCCRLYFRGESQHIDRILEACAERWCECNPNHNFHSKDIVYTVVYSILLLNTDLHWADNSAKRKMTKLQFATNTLDSVGSQLAMPMESFVHKSNTYDIQYMMPYFDSDDMTFVSGGPPITDQEAWLSAMEGLLRTIYTSISKDALTLTPTSSHYTDNSADLASSTYSLFTPYSVHSKSSIVSAFRSTASLTEPEGLSSIHQLSQTASSSGPRPYPNDISRHWIGLASSLGRLMITEELSRRGSDSTASHAGTIRHDDSESIPMMNADLELYGAPWAKEGLVKHKHYSDRSSAERRKKAKASRSWRQVFAVVQSGYFKTFQFSGRNSAKVKEYIGGGNWAENAELRTTIRLNQTISTHIVNSTDSETNVMWSLALPGGDVYMFEAGTSDIAQEFVSCCNYWAARLSKQPLQGAVGNAEYGWSQKMLQRTVESAGSAYSTTTRMSVRDWQPPPLNFVLSTLDEMHQTEALLQHVEYLRAEIDIHSSLKQEIVDKLPRNQAVTYKAIFNWDTKNNFLLKELTKYSVYVQTLQDSLALQKYIHGGTEDEEQA